MVLVLAERVMAIRGVESPPSWASSRLTDGGVARYSDAKGTTPIPYSRGPLAADWVSQG